MIRFTLIFTIGLAVAFAQKESSGTKNRDNAAAGKPAPLSIPAGSIEIAPGVYKHTDSAGKESIYRKTPFGIVKMNDTTDAGARSPETAPVERANPFSGGKDASAKSTSAKTTSAKTTTPLVIAIEEGDTVRFERTTPFGPAKWTRKKSELNEDEREILERSRAAKSGKPGPKE